MFYLKPVSVTVSVVLYHFQIENIRRRHNYLPFIMELLKVLAEDGKLIGLVEKVAKLT